MGLFGTSGIRGIFGEAITVDLARKLGVATAKKYKKIVVGCDTRESGKELDDGFSRAAGMSGADVTQIGVSPTPATAYAARELSAACAIMVTASHNPPQYNGFKFFNPDGSAFTRAQEDEIERLIQYAPVIPGRAKQSEKLRFAHNDRILSEFSRRFSGMKIVLNCNCGAATATAPLLFEKLGCVVYPIFERPDGTYIPQPKGQPVPSLGDWNRIADIDTTLRAMHERGADIGIIFDGDADRMFAVSRDGPIPPDALLYLFASNFAGGSTIVDVVDGSSNVDSLGEVVRVAVGDVNISTKLKELSGRATFGGEGCSGTYVWPKMHYCPDGIYSAVKLLEMVSKAGPLDRLAAAVPKTFLKREKLSIPSELKGVAMGNVRKRLDPSWKVNTIDGVRVDFDGIGWLLIRPSGTEPFLRITVEGKDEAAADHLIEQARKLSEP